MIVISSSKNVLVFKAIGKLPLRIFPEYNDIGNIDLDDYTIGNKAAIGMVKEFIKPAGKDLSGDNLSLAKVAREKNELLNRSAKTLEVTKEKLDNSEMNLHNANTLIQDMRTQMKALEDRLALQAVENDDETVEDIVASEDED